MDVMQELGWRLWIDLYHKMADNSARMNRPTVASTVPSDAIRDLLLGPQTVPPSENAFEPQPVGEARVSMGDHTRVDHGVTTDRDSRPDPPAGLGAAANSVSTSRQIVAVFDYSTLACLRVRCNRSVSEACIAT